LNPPIHPVAKTDLIDVSVTLSDGAQLSLPDLGFGVSQVLPVLVQCAFAPKKSTLLFEQPELHLHDGAARQLAGVFVDVVKNKSAQIIVETHSRHLFHELINEIRAGRISPKDVVLYDVSRDDGASKFRKVCIEIDEGGNCDVDHHWGKALDK
jgi:predicted ATPase